MSSSIFGGNSIQKRQDLLEMIKNVLIKYIVYA